MYNRIQIQNAIKEVKSINITIKTKKDHYSKLEEIRSQLYNLMTINKYTFDPDYYYSFVQYKNNINIKENKSKLDNNLSYCKNCILKDLYSLIQIIDSCEYDEVKQMYVER